ncbi:(deoxy)nucleoside triphosphate pyrophosphohydrolase [Candidatus Pacearchaeota archaeon]|nr:(deoxy)nucleoside triphosphate pyrophosphohydrolase [Candidatus Pacearchaeota archaeon]
MAFPILVTAAIIEDDGKFLITQRPLDKHNGGRWEFPGGKVDFGEDPRLGIEREIDEELGITVKAEELLEYSSHVYNSEKHIILLGIHCAFTHGEIEKKEIADFKWVTLDEMNSYNVTEADLPFIEQLREIESNKC